MKMKFNYIAGLLLATTLLSCNKYLDINKNPNAAVDVDPRLLFSYASTSLINNRAGGDLYIPMALGGQSISGGGDAPQGTSWGPDAEDQYVFSPYSYSNIWSVFYTSVAANLKRAILLAESAAPVNRNGAAQAKVLLAETFYELTTIYGDIPFSEALNDSIKTPKFDSQQEVINGAIALIDEALAEFDPDDPESFEAPYDMFYRGESDNGNSTNIQHWIRAARSLKLRMLMTMVDKDPSKAEAIGQMITAGGMISSQEDNFGAPFEKTAGKRNPKFAIKDEYLGDVDFFYASPYVIDPMNANNDPRRPVFFDKPSGASGYVGIKPGADADDDIHAKLANSLHFADQPEYLFTYQEQLFYEAEIYARGMGSVTVDIARANTLYKQAIMESCKFYGLSQSVAENFVNSLPDLNVQADLLKAIHLQHWIDKMDRGLDAFTQWRRSGPQGSEVPNLTLPANAPAGALFRRYEYPADAETAANPNAPGFVKFNEKMWFDL